jgi:hypothetical protein
MVGVVNSRIFANVLHWNTQNAEDNSADVSWDDEQAIGNSWSDYLSGSNYTIPGSAGSVDCSPINDAFYTGPVQIAHPPDAYCFANDSSTGIYWWFLADTPLDVHIYRNGTEIAAGGNVPWTFYRLDYFGVGSGVYNITITVKDKNNFETEDLVYLYVLNRPTVSSPDDIVYEVGTPGYDIQWVLTNLNPGTYTIELDGMAIQSGPLNSTSETITFALVGIGVGMYNYTILVTQIGYGNLSDTVMLHVGPDTTNPTIDQPEDVIYLVNSTENTIVWTPFDYNPHYYEILRDSILLRWGWWNSSSEAITINIDGLAVGTYSYVLTVSDEFWNNGTDSVQVVVLSEHLSVSSPPDLLYVEGTTGNEITWNILTGIPLGVEIHRNATIIMDTLWTDVNFSLNVDFLLHGTYNFTILIWGVDDYVTDTVWVTVLPEGSTIPSTSNGTLPTTTTEPFDIAVIISLAITIVSVVTIVIFSMAICKTRRRAGWELQMSG